ncbi:40S ribosomal protein S22 [Colletotrichum tamarilloi]|uniref:40S ribosomal protein S22 n=1 Tax=Colletotrichum tamarilloi TaxID=1209934 RepID=A0ABQ9QZ39_9PEZI|nr:40S ribosomal protein S22 [Colletotrichum tamarilloi]KAK1490048.1 40S ribosomal protein S22 [Colletotrichum tamarilloi]
MATCLTSRKSIYTEAAKLSLNKCGVISPHFNVRLGDLEKWGVRLLPARQFGHVVLTTSAGIMDHHQARRKNTSGKILGYFY